MVEKMRIGIALQPVATALFANSPFRDGSDTGAYPFKAPVSSVYHPISVVVCGLRLTWALSLSAAYLLQFVMRLYSRVRLRDLTVVSLMSVRPMVQGM